MKENVSALELLSVWHRLPEECQLNYYIKILLPCFLHYNAPNKETHFDGPPSSQKSIHSLKQLNFKVRNKFNLIWILITMYLLCRQCIVYEFKMENVITAIKLLPEEII